MTRFDSSLTVWLTALATAGLVTAASAAAEAPSPAATDTLERVVPLPEVVVSTTRLGDRAPVARSFLRRDDLVDRNTGQDTPMLLATLPGAYAYSDAGNGIGYSYLSIRGFPQRRISVLVNGVPLNDPQSHEVYWIDHPDLLASTAEAQVQRGVGSALYGAASLGGSVQLETSPFSETPQASVALGYGSYETKRLALEMNSGRLADGWSFYGRYSRIESFGYRDDSWSKLWSYALSARRMFGRQSLRVNAYGGPEETHLAYIGVPPEYLLGQVTGDRDEDRRFNPIAYANERDHFFEPHYELIHSWSPQEGLAFSQTLFWFDGKGYYDEQRPRGTLADVEPESLSTYRLDPWATADSTAFPRNYYRDADGDGVLDRDAQGRAIVDRFALVRRRTVKNRHYGWVPRVRVEGEGWAITLGGELRAADGRHWGEVLSGDGLPPGTEPNHTYYDYHPRTLSVGLFARQEWAVTPVLQATADLAWRHQGYYMRDDRFDGIQFDQPYDFGLPRLGLTWSPRPALHVFGSWAYSEREPSFRDLYDGEGAGSVPLYGVADVQYNVYQDPLVRPEKVHDLELGATFRGEQASASATLYLMSFRDELVYAGQFDTDLGYPILGNAARSIHQGLELEGRIDRPIGPAQRLLLDANLSLADNHFVEYREVYGTAPGDTLSYDGNAIGFFPAVTGNLRARWTWRGASLGGDVQRVGRIYLDNTEQRESSIAPRAVLGLEAGYGRAAGERTRLGARVRVDNVLDEEYETGGWMDYDAGGNVVPFRTPAARRSFLVQLRVDFL